MAGETIGTRFGTGQAIRRIEDLRLLRGQGCYADDVVLAGQAWIGFLRSPHAHARILAIEPAAARALPEVLAVFTGDDLAAAGVSPLVGPADTFRQADGAAAASALRWPLARERARFVGEAVAAVVAGSRAAVLDALEAIEVIYEPLAAAVTPAAAIAAGAPSLIDDSRGNVSAVVRHGDTLAVDAAIGRAAVTVSLDIVNQRVAPVALEPRTVLAWPDPVSGRLFVRASSQMPTRERDSIAAVLGIEVERVRVQVGDVGGGFGMKTGMYPEDAVVAFAARALGRPVRWIATRGEDMVSAVHGRDIRTRAHLALGPDGRFLALRTHTEVNLGAYATDIGLAMHFLLGPAILSGPYRIPVADIGASAVVTNTATIGAYRGAGSPEAAHIMERLVDEAARALSMDPVEIRRRNLVEPTRMPYANVLGQTYECGDYPRVLERALELGDWAGFEARALASAARGRLRGHAVAMCVKFSSANVLQEAVDVRIAADGMIEIASATMAMGQGIATSYAQIAVDVFDVPIERIRIVQGDTDRVNGFGSGGSRSLQVGGSAVRQVAERTIEQARELAADALEVSGRDLEYARGRFTIAGTDRSIEWGALAAAQPGAEIRVEMIGAVAGGTWPYAAHVCEVEIDRDTGAAQVCAYASVNDIGTVVSPPIATGQIVGGIVHSIGQALCEAVVYDPDSGQLLTGSFADYAMPRAGVLPEIVTEFDQSVPTANNPLGAKGVGELGTMAATPAVVNAVIDALVRGGVPLARANAVQMPLTAAKLYAAIRGSASG